MSNVTRIILAACLLGGMLSCKHDDVANFTCPTLTDNVSWESYGSYEFRNEGMDSTARQIVADCDWHVHSGHNGGIGNTLQVTNSGEDVVFVWAYNSFYGYLVRQDWQGKTHNGVGIGVHTTEFHTAHPEFTSFNETTSRYTNGDISVIATFSGGFLVSLNVGHYYRN